MKAKQATLLLRVYCWEKHTLCGELRQNAEHHMAHTHWKAAKNYCHLHPEGAPY